MSAAWAGPFESEMYSRGYMYTPPVKGEISVTLPDVIADMPEALAIFHYTGTYRNGQSAAFRFQYEAPSQTGFGAQGGVVAAAFKGACAQTGQQISFLVTELDPDVMKGAYSSELPQDRGTFTLRRLP